LRAEAEALAADPEDRAEAAAVLMNMEGSASGGRLIVGWGSGRLGVMKYVLLICDDEVDSPSNEEMAADPVHQAWQADLARRGAEVVGIRLRPVVNATTVKVRDGETLVSDGPFAETKDFVGGFVVIECPSLDDAIAIAAGHPYARWGGVEIRPVWE
ncbi:MAG: YciI family protein, partial [Spirillospora sp.]